MKFNLSFWTFILIVILTVLFASGVTWLLWHSQFADNTKLSNIGSILQGVLGVAASLAGAIVTMRIANLANRLVSHEQSREDFEFLNSRLEQALKPIFEIGRDLAALYAFFIIYRSQKDRLISDMSGADFNKLLKPISNKKNNKRFEILGKTISELRKEVGARIIKVAEALDGIYSNSYALFIWTRGNPEILPSKLNADKDALTMKFNVRTDLAEISNIIRAKGILLQLESPNEAVIRALEERLVTFSTKAGSGEAFNNQALRDLLELGLMVFSLNEKEQYRNIGSGLICDLADRIPSTDELMKTLDVLSTEIFPNDLKQRSPIFKLSEGLNPQMAFGISFNQAMESFKQIKPLDIIKLSVGESESLEKSTDAAEIAREKDESGGSNETLNRQEILKECLEMLKNKGVEDSNVDLFLAIFNNDPAGLEAALKDGADPNMTDRKLLLKYKSFLKNSHLNVKLRKLIGDG